MCGRYTLRKSEVALAALGKTVRRATAVRFNIAPSQPVPVCRISPDGSLDCPDMTWGLVPHWSKAAKPPYSTINARAETVRTKPAYRTPFKRQRCLIPCDGWYEWQATGEKRKQPWLFHLRGDPIFYLAGLWDQWDGQGTQNPLLSCSIIVTVANETVGPVHDRMPVILTEQDFDLWLDPANTNTEALETLLRPYDTNDLQGYPVSLAVNNPRRDDAACVQPLA